MAYVTHISQARSMFNPYFPVISIFHQYSTIHQHILPFSTMAHAMSIFQPYSKSYEHTIPATFHKPGAYSTHITQVMSLFYPHSTSHLLLYPYSHRFQYILAIFMRLFYPYSISHQPILHKPSTILPILHHVLLMFHQPSVIIFTSHLIFHPFHQLSVFYSHIPLAISIFYPHCTSNLLLYPYSIRALLLYPYSASHLQICPCVAVVT